MASRDASAAAGAAAFAAAHASDRCAMTEEDPVDEDGRPVMTSRAVLRIVREAGGFTAPEMNDKLWLHNRRWRKIGGLEEFTGAAMLHLGNNHIGPDIGEGLRHLVHLKALHLPRNQIRGALDDNLRHNANLKLLDLSANRISRFPSGGLPPSLNTLLLVGNALEDAASIAPLAELPDLEVLDLKDNKLNGDALFELFPTFLSLKVLYLQGNPIQRAPNYRRKLVSRCAALTYLDAAPVEELEKCGAAAWAVGGADAEREARRRFLDEKTLARQLHKHDANDGAVLDDNNCAARFSARARVDVTFHAIDATSYEHNSLVDFHRRRSLKDCSRTRRLLLNYIRRRRAGAKPGPPTSLLRSPTVR